MKKYSEKELRHSILSTLSHQFGVMPDEATDEQYYQALVIVVREILLAKYAKFKHEYTDKKIKRVYYLCMEFLLGRSLKNNLFNLGIEEEARKALDSLEISLDSLYDQESDAGLGNGGLGRLAACFLDSLATCEYPAMGYCLRYEYGIFRQKLINGWQTELPDFWLDNASVWFHAHPEKSVEILFGGEVQEKWDNGKHYVSRTNATVVTAVPYDMMVSGYNSRGVSQLRLWSAKFEAFDMSLFNSGEYARAVERKATIETITKVLYPEDNHPEGKSLRLMQQYFLVSATVQDIVRRHLRDYRTLDNFAELTAIHLNDTHPVIAIPELMRVLLDDCGYTWSDAWDIVTSVSTYTNHTVMAEALECWSIELFKRQLPRVYQIVEEINRRFCADMHERGIDGYVIGRMAIINDGFVKMSNLAVIASQSVNGVSKLHSEILKNSVFKDFYAVMPDKFKNVTNGIAYRRWLCQSNPALSNFITELIGEGFKHDACELKKLEKFKDDVTVAEQLAKIKYKNKLRMAKYMKERAGIVVDPNSIFDTQVKRLHEYKRQHLNALHILSLYQQLRENKLDDFVPQTFIFGAKAAPGYYFAKQIIRFIVKLGEMINNDPRVKDKLKVVYMEDYCVTIAEKLIPASEVSEQISLAGTEASGTSNMKFMINGAITLGTMDGANVEMYETLGKDNIVIFGMNAKEAEEIKKIGYTPSIYYQNNYILQNVINEMSSGLMGLHFDDVVNSLTGKDPYMVLADFADFAKARQYVNNLYKDTIKWNSMSLCNIANAGIFSSDRSIKEYANNIWHAKPLNE